MILAHFFICLLFFKVINPCKVAGKANVPRGGGILVVSNHLSVLEPLKLDRFYLMDDTKAASREIVDEIMARIARLQEMDRRL